MNHRKHRQGFATVIALIALMLIGVTIAGLMTRIGMEARRTAREADRAQQMQIRYAESMGIVKVPV